MFPYKQVAVIEPMEKQPMPQNADPSSRPPRPLALSYWILGVLIRLNMLAALVALGRFIWSLTSDGASRLTDGPMDWNSIAAARIGLLLSILATLPNHVLLHQLRDMVETVHHGDPFVTRNARRLRLIAWAFFASAWIEAGMVLTRAEATIPAYAWALRLPWNLLMVLLLFILVRVFEEGTRLREELAEIV